MNVGLDDFVRTAHKFNYSKPDDSTFKCGHPRTPENTRQNGTSTSGKKLVRCKICHQADNRHWQFKKRLGIK